MDFYGEEPGYTKELRLFGEIGTKLTKLYGLPDKLSKKYLFSICWICRRLSTGYLTGIGSQNSRSYAN
jgi:hypothetical protein